MHTASDTSEKDFEISELKKKLEEMEKNHLEETKKALEREELFQTERRKLEEEKNQWKGEKTIFHFFQNISFDGTNRTYLPMKSWYFLKK